MKQLVSESIKNLLQSIKKKGKGNGAMFPLAIMMIMMMLIFLILVYKRHVLEYNYSYINNSLTQAMFGGCLPNIHEYADTGNLIIQDSGNAMAGDVYFLNSYEKFRDCLKYNLNLDDGWNIDTDHGIYGQVTVERYTVFNVVTDSDGNTFTTEITRTGDNSYVREYSVNDVVTVTTTDGDVDIVETSVYAEISFNLSLVGHIPWMGGEDLNRRYRLRRVVAVKQN